MSILSGRKKPAFIGFAILVLVAAGAAYIFFSPYKKTGQVVAPSVLPSHKPSARKEHPAMPPSVSAPPATAAVLPVPPRAEVPPALNPISASSPRPVKLSSSPDKAVPVKPVRSKTSDLRYCLKLETDQAIAKCAGE